jgi:hypothetical protein
MSSLVSEETRRLVAERADFLCEYCLLHEDDGFFAFQLDHIISRKHGGSSDPANLAFACAACNRRKGSDLGTVSARTGALTRFFNPRADIWPEHFELASAVIEPLSDIADGTARILGFNELERLAERRSLIVIGRYPSIAALARLRQ